MNRPAPPDFASLAVVSAFLVVIWSPLFIFGGAA